MMRLRTKSDILIEHRIDKAETKREKRVAKQQQQQQQRQ